MTVYRIYDDEWEDESLSTEKDIVKFSIEHYFDRADDLHGEWDYLKEIGEPLSKSEQKIKTIGEKLEQNQEITFEESLTLLKYFDFKVKEVKETKEVKTEETKVYRVHDGDDNGWTEIMGTEQLRNFALDQIVDYLDFMDDDIRGIEDDITNTFNSKAIEDRVRTLLEGVDKNTLTINDFTDSEAIEVLKLRDFDVDELFIE